MAIFGPRGEESVALGHCDVYDHVLMAVKGGLQDQGVLTPDFDDSEFKMDQFLKMKFETYPSSAPEMINLSSRSNLTL